MRRRLLALLAAAGLVAGAYLFWLRDSSLVRVETVTVTGLTSEDAGRLRSVLVSEARTMTTLHVRRDELHEAVSGFPVVSRLEVSADFPSTLRIHVVEHRPAAVVAAGGAQVPVASDGTVLEGLPDEKPLPVVELRGALPDQRLEEGGALRSVKVLGAAPAALQPRLEDAGPSGGRGLVVQLRDGPELVFGEPVRLHAKWTAAARVLSDPASQGATYLDLRLPERPAAGGLPAATLAPVAPAGEPIVPEAAATAPATPADQQPSTTAQDWPEP